MSTETPVTDDPVNEVSLSLWLPVSRPNFYSATEDDWLDMQDFGSVANCKSNRLSRPKYVPLLLVSTLRRLLEVMPRSFGYDEVGRCELRGDSPARRRPVNVTMTADLTVDGETDDNYWIHANGYLQWRGATTVSLFVDENGWYSFTATYRAGADPAEIRKALIWHIRRVFGGDYVVHPLPAKENKKVDVGSASLKDYNGHKDNPDPHRNPDADDDVFVTQPKGTMSFSQLNILAEGMWNDMLSPAVYLEQNEFMDKYLDSDESADFLRSVADVIEALTTDADAQTTRGQIVVLHHFLNITSNGSLMKLKSALESVRRRLLDEMISSTHRQSRLVQLRFSTNGHERRPELAVGATETQLKGYATLVAAKFPLIKGVGEMTRLAKEHLEWVVDRDGPIVLRAGDTRELLNVQMTRLRGQVDHWQAVITDLDANVLSLSRTIEHAWMEALLYEQKQARSDQEAMAEIERSRLSRPANGSPGRAAYNLVMLLLAVVAVVFTVTSSDLSKLGEPGTTWWDVVVLLRPVWVVALLAFVVVPLAGAVLRASREKHGKQPRYPYEFTFRLNENVSRDKLQAHVGATATRRKLPSPILGKVWAVNRGYGRIEHKSTDSTIVKIHMVIAIKMGLLKYARFEVISEVLSHKIARKTQHVLVQCRAFGESPRPLTDKELIELLRLILGHLLGEIATDTSPDEVAQLISESLYGSESAPEVDMVIAEAEEYRKSEVDEPSSTRQEVLTR